MNTTTLITIDLAISTGAIAPALSGIVSKYYLCDVYAHIVAAGIEMSWAEFAAEIVESFQDGEVELSRDDMGHGCAKQLSSSVTLFTDEFHFLTV